VRCENISILQYVLSNPLKKKVLFMAYNGKTTFNIDGITIHSSLFIPLNCKYLPSLSSKRLNNLVNFFDQFTIYNIR
jgi:hypothetical protein